MQTLFAPLFQPFAILNNPIRFFLLLFLTVLGGFHLANDLKLFIFDKEFMEIRRLVMTSLVLSALIFSSRYLKQRNLKQTTSQTIAT